MKGLTLTQKEQARLQVLNGILEGQISVDEAAEVLGVSDAPVCGGFSDCPSPAFFQGPGDGAGISV